jgi:hypothetical protein
MGSKVIPGVESVTADLILESMVDEESVMVTRDAALGADLDILVDGSRSDKILLEGTASEPFLLREGVYRDIPILISGRGNKAPYCLLKDSIMSLVSSRCWSWSSPTGTNVDLNVSVIRS